MPISLPDPVLALSMASLQKLNTADVDQLANLWNVFTKCKESIESGRRLENLSWRLWFREAHLLPPDTSLSDLTDFTPLDTPLMSRRSSMAGSFQPSTRSIASFVPSQQQPSHSLTSRALQAAALAMAATPNRIQVSQTELSDPEDGEDWSSEDDSEEESQQQQQFKLQQQQNRGRTQREQAFSPSNPSTSEVKGSPSISRSLKSGRNSAMTSPKSVTSPLARELTLSQQAGQQENPSIVAAKAQLGDRKRAVSSSSAFGSRARVKQHNMQRRRRPLSFQQAIESLLLGHESDLSLGRRILDGSATSLPKSIDETILSSTASRLSGNGRAESVIEDLESSNLTVSEQKPPQNSAPAEFSRPTTPQKMASTIIETGPKPVRRVSIAEEPKESPKQSRFFVGGASFEGSEHSLESESSTSLMNASNKYQTSSKSPVQAFRNLHPTSSEAGSHDGNRKVSGNRAHHAAHHHAPHHAPHHHAPHHHAPHHHAPHHHGRGLTGNTRIKSALNLHRGGGHGRAKGSHVRIASMTTTKDSEEHQTAPEDTHDTVAEESKKVRQPVKFTMGSIGTDSDEDSLTTSEKQSHSRPKQSQGSKRNDENSDEWASDSSTDSEEERRLSDERRKREERERVDNMFKKIPIRSQSAADIRHLTPYSGKENQSDEDSVEGAGAGAYSNSPAPPPLRSLLSTIFHPEREDDNSYHRRSGSKSPKQQKRKTSHEGSEIAQTVNNLRKNSENESSRIPSIGSYMNNSGLKMSKSAVALPVLSTLGSRSSTSISRKEAQGASRSTAVFDDASSDGSKNSDGNSSAFGHPSRQSNNSEAVERLNELTQARQQNKKNKKRQQRSASNGDAVHRSSTDGGEVRNRISNSSLDVQVQPEFDEEEMIRQHRRTSEPFEIPAGESGNRIPYRSKSAVNVPEVGLPQSPRTTRRNMLRDELSESLRQNLLWERQSRNRMLGIGGNRLTSEPISTNVVREDQQQPNKNGKPSFPPLTNTTSEPLSRSHIERSNRNQSVLGGNALRPLTQRSSTVNNPNSSIMKNENNVASSSTSQRRQPSRVNYSGDFHHTGW